MGSGEGQPRDDLVAARDAILDLQVKIWECLKICAQGGLQACRIALRVNMILPPGF